MPPSSLSISASGLPMCCAIAAEVGGLSSNADVVQNAAKITVPSMVIYYRGDNAIFPSDARAVYDAIGAGDKQLASAPGDHYGFGVGTQERSGAPQALAQVVAWLRERFPAS